MNIRLFGLRDLPLLYSYRNHGLFLDSSRVLIHGPSMLPIQALVGSMGFSPRIFTYQWENSSQPAKPLIGQVTCVVGASFGRLSFLAPEEALGQPELTAFSEFIASQLGQQGMFHILADVDEEHEVFQLLHRAGFAIYARQRVWRLDGIPAGEADATAWRPSRSGDMISVRSLYCNVVPGLVQQVEPLPKNNLQAKVYYQKGELLAFAELKYGRNGIWVQPFVHPDTQGFDRHLVHLLQELPGKPSRPLYICVRAYQSWLESDLEAMGAQPGPQQAVMVRHIALARRVNQSIALPAMDGTRIEPTAPLMHIENSNVNEPAKLETRS